jgi:DNA polymerase III subunit epsilon
VKRVLGLFRRRAEEEPPDWTPAVPADGYAVLDVETTGLSPLHHRVLEVAVVRTDARGRVLGEWVQRVHPDGPVGATHVHGITDADVAGAPRFGDVLPTLNAWLAGAVLVAHNARFDLAFLRAEYAYQGWALPWLPSLCTLEASGHYLPALDRRRLADCCAAARVRLDGAHSALGDARATAALLGHYLDPRSGVPPRDTDLAMVREAGTVRWPDGPTRRPQSPADRAVIVTRIRARTARAVSAPALVTLLAGFSLVDVLDEGAPAGTLPYLEKLAETLADGVLSDDEVAVLDDVAGAYRLSEDDRTRAHQALLLVLCHAALDDGRVGQDERAELRAMAGLLGLPDRLVLRTLEEAEAARTARLGAGLRPPPPDWPHGEPLRVGDKVAFTGGEEQLRAHQERRAATLGLRVMENVSRHTALLVTDGAFRGTKAEAAGRLGTRTVRPHDFEVLLRHLQPANPRLN